MVPPAKADKQSTRDVLDGPEIKRQEEHDRDEVDHIVVAEERAEDIRQHRPDPKHQMEEDGHGMSWKSWRIIDTTFRIIDSSSFPNMKQTVTVKKKYDACQNSMIASISHVLLRLL